MPCPTKCWLGINKVQYVCFLNCIPQWWNKTLCFPSIETHLKSSTGVIRSCSSCSLCNDRPHEYLNNGRIALILMLIPPQTCYCLPLQLCVARGISLQHMAKYESLISIEQSANVGSVTFKRRKTVMCFSHRNTVSGPSKKSLIMW